VVDRWRVAAARPRADLTRIADALVERGYLHVDVKSSAERQHSPERDADLHDRPGRTLVGDIDLVGDPGIPPAELLKQSI
jgi:hypothetical protein